MSEDVEGAADIVSEAINRQLWHGNHPLWIQWGQMFQRYTEHTPQAIFLARIEAGKAIRW